MVSSARIEELERKFNENPRRYFAPLANEYRKAGDLQQAIAICRTYIPQQPAHISGHIVFGQALFEAGEFEEARAVFESALGLDPENLIALRHLGDIARGRADIASARTWYQRVLDADPRNPEIVSLIASLGPVAVPVPALPTHEATYGMQHAGGARATDDASGWGRINPETLELPRLSIEVRKAEEERKREPAGATVPTEESHTEPTAASAPEPPPDRHADPPPVEVRAADADAPAETAPPAEQAAPTIHEEPPAPVDVAAFAAGVQGFGSDVTADDQSVDAAFESQEASLSGFEAMEFVPPSHAPAAEETAATSETPPAEYADDLTPSAFVTETMAELYVQQGFRQEALDVYRQLLRKSPNDATLIDRIQQLESEMAQSESAPAPGPSDSGPTDSGPADSGRTDSGSSDPGLHQAGHREADNGDEGPAGAESAGAGSIRAFFARLVGRRVIPRGSDYAPADAVPVTAEDVAHDALGADTFGADRFGAEPLGADALSATNSGSTEFEYEQSPEFTFSGSSEFHDTASFDTGAFEALHSEPPGAGARFAHENSVNASLDASPDAGSVDVLFPEEPVPSSDEAAAAALSGAFGGPSMTQAMAGVSAIGHAGTAGAAHTATRPARDELSLDSIFRDEDAEHGETHTSRGSANFSFDQFFADMSSDSGQSQPSGEGSAGGADVSPDATGASDPLAFETEQFTNWLAGLKKK
jgi:tetratricopeptide (TPR) repeat protein